MRDQEFDMMKKSDIFQLDFSTGCIIRWYFESKVVQQTCTVIGRSFLSSSRSVVVLFTIFLKSKPALKHSPWTYIRSSVSHSQCPPTQLLTNVVLTLTSAIVPTCTIGNMTSNEWETRNLMWALTPAKHSRLVSVKATCWEWTYYNMWHGDAHWEDGLRDIIALPAQSLLLDDESGVIHQEFQSPTVSSRTGNWWCWSFLTMTMLASVTTPPLIGNILTSLLSTRRQPTLISSTNPRRMYGDT